MDEHSTTKLFSVLIVAPAVAKYVPSPFQIGSTPIQFWQLTIVAVAGFALYTLHPTYEISLTVTDVGILALLAVLVSSIFWSIAPTESVTQIYYQSYFVPYYLSIVIYLDRDRSVTYLVGSLLLFSSFVALVGLFTLFLGDVNRTLVARVSYNSFSRDAVGLLPLTVAAGVYTASRRRFYWFGVGALLAISVLLSGSRGGAIGLTFVLIALVVAHLRLRYGVTLATLSVLSTAALVVLLLGVYLGSELGLIPQRIQQIPLTPTGLSPEILGEKRYRVHVAEFETIKDHWLTGIGYGALNEVTAGFGGYQAHSMVTRFWLAGGVGAVVLLLATYASVIQQYVGAILHSSDHGVYYTTALLIGLLGITIAGFLNIVITEPLFWILFGMGGERIARLRNSVF